MEQEREKIYQSIIQLWKKTDLDYVVFIGILEEIKNEITVGHLAAHLRARLKHFGFDISDPDDNLN